MVAARHKLTVCVVVALAWAMEAQGEQPGWSPASNGVREAVWRSTVSFQDGKKTARPRKGSESLEVRCLRDGTLDVCLETGTVYSARGGQRTKARATREDRHGYLWFQLNRERPKKVGRCERERRGKHVVRRYRERRSVLVHRLVKIKAIAVGMGGDHWRCYVTDLPRGVDVNHIEGNRRDNRACKLELQTERVNRGRGEMQPEDYAACTDYDAWEAARSDECG